MRIAHRKPVANFWDIPESDPVDAAYEAEVKRHTEHGEHEYARREGRLKRAESRLASALRRKATVRQLTELAALVEIRREELEEYRRMMVSSAVSAEHRGTRSYRPVPTRQGSGLLWARGGTRA